jgi:hypothetical protein
VRTETFPEGMGFGQGQGGFVAGQQSQSVPTVALRTGIL